MRGVGAARLPVSAAARGGRRAPPRGAECRALIGRPRRLHHVAHWLPQLRRRRLQLEALHDWLLGGGALIDRRLEVGAAVAGRELGVQAVGGGRLEVGRRGRAPQPSVRKRPPQVAAEDGHVGLEGRVVAEVQREGRHGGRHGQEGRLERHGRQQRRVVGRQRRQARPAAHGHGRERAAAGEVGREHRPLLARPRGALVLHGWGGRGGLDCF